MRKALMSVLTACVAVCLVDSAVAGDRIVLRRPVFTDRLSRVLHGLAILFMVPRSTLLRTTLPRCLQLQRMLLR
jgi:hypothetical protein